MNSVYRISAVTLMIKNMKRSCNFYSNIPGFRLTYGGSNDSFTTFEIGADMPKMFLNLELATNRKSEYDISASTLAGVIFILITLTSCIHISRAMKKYQIRYCLKMNQWMHHGVKDIFIYWNQMDISFHLQSH